jgi:serine/threonine protein kinase
VGDFFRIDADGYTLNEAKSNERPLPEQPTPSSTNGHDSLPSPAAGSLSSGASHSSVASPASVHAAPPRGATSSAIGSAASAAAAVNVTSLSDLIVLNPIGQGASGLVQRVALRSNPAVQLALKVVPLDLSEAKSKQILIELRTLHYAEHENIVNFYGAFYKERSMSLVLEYMDRGSLSDCLKRLRAKKLKQQKKRREQRIRRWQQQHPDASTPMPNFPSPNSPILSEPLVEEKYISCVARQLLSGLHYLHITRRLIHRDIKPSNILLSSSAAVKLADFGVSGELQEASDNQNKISFVGTVTFMSPERIQGHPHSFDSDLWSLGLVLAEMTLGYFPYAKPTTNPETGEEIVAEVESSEDEGTPEGEELSEEEEQDEQKDSKRPKRAGRVTSIGSHSDSPSSSATSTPSHQAISLTSPSSSLGDFVLAGGAAGKYAKEHDLYNATQTHAPGFAMPPLGSPTERSNLLSVQSLKRPSSSLSVLQSPQLGASSHSPILRPSSASGDHPQIGSGSNSSNGGSGQKKAITKSKSFGFWDIMQRIVQSSAPLLPSRISKKTGKEKYSPEFRSFIESCLKKNPKERPTALELLQHPFILQHADVTLDAWLKTIPEPPPVRPSTLQTPSFRPAVPIASPSWGATAMIGSPSSMVGTAPLASPRPSGALPPLPHRRRHHSISESPRAGGFSGFLQPPALSAGSNAMMIEETSEIETFPVTPSVPGFANAYESFPIAVEEVSAPMTEETEITMGDITATSSIATSSVAGTSRMKRKPTTDISVEVDDGDSISLAPQLDSTTSQQSTVSAAGRTIFPHSSFVAPSLVLHSGSAPSSTRSDVVAPRSTFPLQFSSHSANASPPSSGRVQGATTLKRLKSGPSDQQDEAPTSVHQASDVTMTSTAAVPSASALFKANLSLIKAQRAESLTQPFAHLQSCSPSSIPHADHAPMTDVRPSALQHTDGGSPASANGQTNAAGGASLLSPFTPATGSKLTKFTLTKENK